MDRAFSCVCLSTVSQKNSFFMALFISRLEQADLCNGCKTVVFVVCDWSLLLAVVCSSLSFILTFILNGQMDVWRLRQISK